MLRLGALVLILLAETIANDEHPCYDTCNCTTVSIERCKAGQVLVESCRCCYFCMPAHLRCMGLGPACNPINCNGKYCWCYNPINNKQVGSSLPYRIEYAYVNNCEDLWYFFHMQKFHKSTKAKVNTGNNGLKSSHRSSSRL